METRPSDAYLEALFDDLNTPRANAHLFALAQKLETAAGDDRGRLKGELLACGALAGFLQADPEAWFQGGAAPAFRAAIEALMARRDEARAAKDWKSADNIRHELSALEVEVMDGPDGGSWRLRQKT